MSNGIKALSKHLATAGIAHVVVSSLQYDNDIAKVLYKNKDRIGDVEIDLSEDDHLRATYTAIVFKPKKFVEFLEKNGVDQDELQKFLEKNKKDIARDLDVHNDVVGVLVTETNDGDVFVTLNTAGGFRSKVAALQEKEELLEDPDSSEDEDYDPETDEIEED